MTKREFIKNSLKRNHLTQVWLIERLEARGIHVDKSEMSSILKGTRKGNKTELVLNESYKILEKYEVLGV